MSAAANRRSDRFVRLALATALILVGVGSCSCSSSQVKNDDSVAVALPATWETDCGVSVTDTPQARPGWFAVSGDWLEDAVRVMK